MRLSTFWHVLIGLNLGLCVVSVMLQSSSLLTLNIISILACGVAGHFARIREES